VVAGLAFLWGAAVSFNRIAFGAHYLSDVLIAWGLTGIIVLALYVWLGPFASNQSLTRGSNPTS
jgi:membrane-associated phospholipid phosphatase